jgi:hypothetical protein
MNYFKLNIQEIYPLTYCNIVTRIQENVCRMDPSKSWSSFLVQTLESDKDPEQNSIFRDRFPESRVCPNWSRRRWVCEGSKLPESNSESLKSRSGVPSKRCSQSRRVQRQLRNLKNMKISLLFCEHVHNKYIKSLVKVLFFTEIRLHTCMKIPFESFTFWCLELLVFKNYK